MATSTRAVVVALISVIVCPLFLYFEVVAFLLAAMIIYEPSNPLLIKIAFVVAVILICAVAVALPVIAFVMGKRARNFIRLSDTPIAGASKALAAQVISGVVFAGVVIVQIFLILWAAGVCSLDGC
ncbi:MAG: hypothetical protein WCJ73_10375 [Actinomycetes bacterium]